MSTTLAIDVHFDAAHRLPHVPLGHKCGRLHGHSYKLTVEVTGPLQPELGWIMDLGDVQAAVAPIVDQLDHHYLNDLPALTNPTCEVVVAWIWQQLRPALPALSRLVLHESPTCRCIYTGP